MYTRTAGRELGGGCKVYKQWDKRERGRERRRIPMKPGDPAKKSGSTPFIIITPLPPSFLDYTRQYNSLACGRLRGIYVFTSIPARTSKFSQTGAEIKRRRRRSEVLFNCCSVPPANPPGRFLSSAFVMWTPTTGVLRYAIKLLLGQLLLCVFLLP
jgi:hypothetical protein